MDNDGGNGGGGGSDKANPQPDKANPQPDKSNPQSDKSTVQPDKSTVQPDKSTPENVDDDGDIPEIDKLQPTNSKANSLIQKSKIKEGIQITGLGYTVAKSIKVVGDNFKATSSSASSSSSSTSGGIENTSASTSTSASASASASTSASTVVKASISVSSVSAAVNSSPIESPEILKKKKEDNLIRRNIRGGAEALMKEHPSLEEMTYGRYSRKVAVLEKTGLILRILGNTMVNRNSEVYAEALSRYNELSQGSFDNIPMDQATQHALWHLDVCINACGDADLQFKPEVLSQLSAIAKLLKEQSAGR